MELFLLVVNSVPDQCHFSTDPDPDPWIRILDLQIRLRIRILLFSSVTLLPTKNKFFSYLFCLLLSIGTVTSVFKDKKSVKCHHTAEIKVFYTFFCLLMHGRIRIWIRTSNYRSGSGTLIISVQYFSVATVKYKYYLLPAVL
jgi:hypothetical protein